MRLNEALFPLRRFKSDMTDHQALAAIDSWNYITAPEVLQKS